MGGMGRCCCTCDCLPIEDLPTITISGHTGNGWSGDCCFEQTFTPNSTPSWSKNCSGMLFEGSVSESCTTEHWQRLTPTYRGYEFLGEGGCLDLPENFCCPDGADHIATTQTEWDFADNAFMAVWRRPKHVIVRISQEEVDCEGVEGQTGGCKIVIRSRYVYDYQSKVYQNAQTKVTQTVAMVNDTCFEVNPDHEIDDSGSPLIDCDGVPSEPPTNPIDANCLYTGTIYFDRVKYYDTMPSGSITFGNSDVPGCDSSSCDYSPYNYVDSVCIYGPTGEVDTSGCLFNLPCYCTGTVVSVSPSDQSETVTCIGESVREKQGCFDDPCVPASCAFDLITICNNPGEPPLFETDCDDYFTAALAGFVCSGGSGRDGIGSDGTMGGPFVTTDSDLKYLSCGGCSDGCYFANPTDTGPSYPYLPLFDCDDSPCDQDCCRFVDECPCCPGECNPLFRNGVSTVTSHTRTQTCTGLQSASVCTNAPSWTITLA